MKRLFIGALAALLSFAALAATTTPVQLLNPSGSTAGQAIISTGPSSAPVWGAVPLTGITGTLAIANGGTGATSASSALSNLGAFPVAGGTMTGSAAISMTSPTFSLLDTSQAGGAGRFRFISTGGTLFIQRNTAAAGNFTTNTTPLSFSASDVGAFSQRPTFNGATPYDSANLTIANYALLASPTFTGTVTAPVVKTTGMSRVKASTTNAQSIPNNAFTTVTTWTTTQNQGSNFVASTGVYTVPSAGDYDVRAGVRFTAATGVIGTQVLIAVAVNGTNVYQSGMAQQNTSGFASQAAGSWLVNCSAGDTITVRVFQNSGAAMTLDGVAGANYVQISQVP